MTSITKWLKYPAMATALLILAACQTPLSQPDGFKFELVGSPVSANEGTTITVRLVHTDETVVPNAQLYAVHWTGTGAKGSPRRQQLAALTPNGHGEFTYSSSEPTSSEHLSLAARVTPDASPIYGTIEVH